MIDTADQLETLGEIIPPQHECTALFVPKGLDKIIAAITAEVSKHVPDVSTEKGRKAIASLARKVASSKTRLEEYGKDASAKIKIQAAGIDSERKRMRELLDELRDKVRKPLTDYEEAEESRTRAHEDALLAMTELGNIPFGASVEDVQSRFDQLDGFAMRDWQEFSARFSTLSEVLTLRIGKILEESKQRYAQQAEFAKLEAERIAREAREHDEQVAREATENVARELAEAKERERLAVEKAEQDRVEAWMKAKRDKDAAVALERKRQADEAQREAEAKSAREADEKHVASINEPIREWLVKFGLTKKVADALVASLSNGDIPNVKVVY